MQQEAAPGWIIFLGLAFVVGGLVAIYFAARLWRLAAACKFWPTAQGTITSSSIGTYETSQDVTESVTQYGPLVEYDYVVDGQTLHGNRIRFGGAARSSNLDKIRAVVSAYPVGGSVNVYYDPVNPSECTLDRKVSSCGLVILFLFGLIFVIVGSGVLFLYAIIAAGN